MGDYDKQGNRLTPYRTVHKSRKRNRRSSKNSNGFYELWEKIWTSPPNSTGACTTKWRKLIGSSK